VSRQLAVEVHDLEKRFEKAAVQALAGVSFDVEHGEIFGYLGRNGAGKSTTVRILTTLLRPTGGRASVAGYDVCSQATEVRRIVGAALQEAALDDLMTGREHLLLAARLVGLGKEASRLKAEELLDAFGLRAAGDRIASRYSGGMRRRLDVAMAIVRVPAVLFLDEPTTGLDPQGRRAVWDLVRQLRDQGSTVFLTTQNLAEAEQISVRVAIVHEGRIAAIGSPEELKARFAPATTVRVRVDPERITHVRQATDERVRSLGDDGWLEITVGEGGAAVAALIARLGAAATIERLSISPPSLEDVFVNLTGAEIESSAGTGDAGAIAATRRARASCPVNGRDRPRPAPAASGA
jgi:ABC-2 type transport system ATP-binding protein